MRDIPTQVPNARRVNSGLKASGPAVSRRPKIELRRAKRRKICWPVFLFLIALVVPWVIFIGPLRMSVYRFVLLVMVLPCLGMWMAGKAGRIRTADIALLLFSLWCALSLIVIHGMALAVQPAGILLIETLGPYLLARCYIRNADDFYNVVHLLFKIVVFLLPFAILELISGQNLSRELFRAILPTESFHPMLPRLGLTRVQSVFDHPIEFGVFTGSIVALVHSVIGYQQSFAQRTFRTGIVGATSILSLSSGPMISMVVQWVLLSGNWLARAMKIPWKMLTGCLILIVLTIEMFANRSLPELVSSFLTLDETSYWFRLVIWHYGSASALNHPIFGVGMNEWERPDWMPSSIDNFLLLHAIRYGLPAPFLLLLVFLSLFVAVGRKKGLDDKIKEYRMAFLVTMVGFLLVGWTVHFWGVVYVLLMFLMGSGVWIIDVDSKETAASRAQGVRTAGSAFPGQRGYGLT
jgi:hypothetical protein